MGTLDLAPYLERVRHEPSLRFQGRVVQVVGLSIEAEGLAPPEYPASSQGTQIEHSHSDLLDLTLEIGHRVQDLVGPEREGHDFLTLGDAAQHQDRMQACFHAGTNVGVHAIADHCSGL